MAARDGRPCPRDRWREMEVRDGGESEAAERESKVVKDDGPGEKEREK